MRCTRCRQEIAVPDSASPTSSSLGREPEDNSPTDGREFGIPAWAFVERPPIDMDAWRWDEDVLEAERLVRTFGGMREAQSVPSPPAHSPATWPKSRIDQSHAPSAPQKRSARHRSPAVTFIAWTFLSVGVMALVFGGVLLAWSCWTGRPQFWTLGLPFALGGQAGLILGLILQLDGLWQSNHDATAVLTELDEQIGELRQATSLLSTSHSGHAQSFYMHLAEGASPHMLLSDLKGQLDLLAMRMAKDGS